MNFSITSKMNKRDYTKIMFIGLYKKPVFILGTILGAYLLTTVALNYLQVIHYYDALPLYEIICGSILVLAPTLIVLISLKQFNANPSFQNDIVYTFSDSGLALAGSTFKNEFTWAHIVKQKKIDNYLILYHTKKFGNFIDMSKLTEKQLSFIKSKVIKR